MKVFMCYIEAPHMFMQRLYRFKNAFAHRAILFESLFKIMKKNYAPAMWIVIGLVLLGLLACTLYLLNLDRERAALSEQRSSWAQMPPPTKNNQKVQHIEGGAAFAAIIVDDLGTDMALVNSLLEIGEPLTYSVLPHQTYSRAIAEILRSQDQEVMLHLPMEPLDYPRKAPGKGALLSSMGRDELISELEADVHSFFPFAGVNNHMGSLLTEDRMRMDWVMDYLSQYNLFFIDSLTTPRSIALESARARGIRCTSRDIFLDNEQGVKATIAQIERLGTLALKKGAAIGICHPYPTTIQALSESLPRLKGRGVRIVHASSLAR